MVRSTSTGWPPPAAADRSPASPRQPPEDPRTRHHAPQPVRPLPRRRGRRHDHRAHQNDADGLQPDHDRKDEQRREEDVQHPDREPEAYGEVGVEAYELELLPEDEEKRHYDPAQNADGHHALPAEGGGLPEEELVEPRLRRDGQLLDVREEDKAEAEEHP